MNRSRNIVDRRRTHPMHALGRTVMVVLLLNLALLVAIIAFNTLRKPSQQMRVAASPPAALDAAAASRRLAGALALPTMSYDERPDASADAFIALQAYLQRAFPAAHAAMYRETINRYSLLYTWRGSDASAKPILLMAHQDVVPPGNAQQWTHPPFSGRIQDGFVWGRGAWDDKGNLVAMMEAVDALARQGFVPRQTVYFAFGHDEENGGEHGAKAIAQLLQRRGVRLDFVLDEGMLMTEGVFKDIDRPVVLVGVAEKGMVTLTLRASAVPGHSSMPSADSAIVRLAQALVRLEAAPMPAAIDGVSADMFDALAPEMSPLNRVLLSNRWLTGGLVRSRLEQSPVTNAMLRTTIAFTRLRSGDKTNVLPGQATATINARLHPRESVEDVVGHVRRAIADPGIVIHVDSGREASPTSRTETRGFRLVERSLREVYPNAVVAPALIIGGTDAKHMAALTDDIYRISPVRARSEDIPRYHGIDERISIANYVELINVYVRLLVDANAVPAAARH